MPLLKNKYISFSKTDELQIKDIELMPWNFYNLSSKVKIIVITIAVL